MVMLVWLYVRRLPAMMHYAVSEARLESGEAVRQLPPQAQWPADNYNNLMEQPTLFYALCLGVYLAGIADADLEYFAWLYVGLRVLHSIIQATANITVHPLLPVHRLVGGCSACFAFLRIGMAFS
ncbi:MAG: MAPEG family protein [Asticcacaulis sp.]